MPEQRGKSSRQAFFLLLILWSSVLALITPAHVLAAANPEPVELISPPAGAEVVARRPEISCRINTSFRRNYLYVYLDGVDVSGILEISEKGFQVKPIAALPSGSHTLVVMFYGQDGQQIYKEFSFSSRHSETFDELSSANEITARYQAVLDKPSDSPHIPYSAIDANLATASAIKKENWRFSLDGNIRYVDQNAPLTPPPYKGANVNNFIAKLERSSQQGGYHLLAEVGDVVVNESATTIQNMGRRGSKLTVDYKDVTVSGFVVNSAPIYGLRSDDDFGIDSSDDDHLMGISGQLKLMGNKVSLKSVYITGGETGGGFGLYTEQGGSKGHVAGAVLEQDFFNKKLVAQQEFFVSSFDPNTADTWESEDDKAYRLGLHGASGQYFYQGVYEYFGPYYSVAGQYITSDREGFTIMAGKNFSSQNLSVQVSQYNDNVENDDFYPIVQTTQAMATYNLSKFQRFPMSLSYSKTMMESSSEPQGIAPIHTDTDVVSGTVSYFKNTLNLSLQPSYSLQNDRFSDNDTSNTGVALSANYAKEILNVASLFSFNRASYDLSNEESDTYLANLQLQGWAIKDLLSYGVSSSYTLIEAEIAGRSDTFAADAEIAYFFTKGKVAGLINPTIGFRSTYTKTWFDTLDDEDEELVFYLVLTSRIPLKL